MCPRGLLSKEREEKIHSILLLLYMATNMLLLLRSDPCSVRIKRKEERRRRFRVGAEKSIAITHNFPAAAAFLFAPRVGITELGERNRKSERPSDFARAQGRGGEI